MLTENEIWRRNNKIDDLDVKDFQEFEKMKIFHDLGKSIYGHPVVYYQGRKIFPGQM